VSQTSPINRVSDYACEATEQARDVVSEHPLPSATVAFAAGLGLGIAAVVLLSESARPTHANVTQRLGQQMMDAMSNVLPRSFTS